MYKLIRLTRNILVLICPVILFIGIWSTVEVQAQSPDVNLSWIIPPALPHSYIFLCNCGFFKDLNHNLIDPRTGAIIPNRFHYGHGGPSPDFVYDPSRNLFGHPSNISGYHHNIGMHPPGDFERVLAQRQEWLHDWLLYQSGGLISVQSVDSSLREVRVNEFTGDESWLLTPDAFSGQFALMYNRVLVTDFIFDAAAEQWQRFGFIHYPDFRTIDLIAASMDGKWGMADRAGDIVIPFIFDNLVAIDENTAFARYNGSYGILNIQRTLAAPAAPTFEATATVQVPEPWQEAYGRLLRSYISEAQYFILCDINGAGIPEVFIIVYDMVHLYTFFENESVFVAANVGGFGTGWGWSLAQSGQGLISDGGYAALLTISHQILVGRELVTVQQGFVQFDPMQNYAIMGHFLAPFEDYYLGTGILPEIPGVTSGEFWEAFPERLGDWQDYPLTEGHIQIALTAPTPAPQNNAINVTINGAPVNFPNRRPENIDGRIMIPVRGVFEALGFEVAWNEQARQVTLSRANDTIVITIDNPVFTANGESIPLDVPAQIIGYSTMLPIRAVVESMGYGLDWDEGTQTVIISTN